MKRFFFSLFTILFVWIASMSVTYAAVAIPWVSELSSSSMSIPSNGSTITNINAVWFRLLSYFKTILSAVFVLFMVYTGAMMIMSMGSDEEKLSSAKRQLWYSLFALLFINIPGAIYKAFRKDSSTSVWNFDSDTFTDMSTESSGNLLFNFFSFSNTVTGRIAFFLEIVIFFSAIIMLTLAGLNVLTSRGREERLKEAKSKFLYTILALIFVGMIEAWKRLAFTGDLTDGQNLFEDLANLALFFAAPVAIFFLSLAGYYFITSAGDEDKVKKAKSMVINTVLATLILLAGYTFLLDLSGLF